jgi:hypothetical protein
LGEDCVWNIDSLSLCQLAQDFQYCWIRQAIEYETSIPTVKHQSSLTQGFQVLGNIGLPPPKGRFEMTDASFLRTNGKQDLQAGGLADGLEQVRERFDGRYIRHNEYIITDL